MKTLQVKLDETNQQRVKDLMEIYRVKTMSGLIKKMLATEHARWFEKTPKYIDDRRSGWGYK